MTKELVSKQILATCYGKFVATANATRFGGCLMVRATLRWRMEYSMQQTTLKVMRARGRR
jgi:hypothetical protein